MLIHLRLIQDFCNQKQNEEVQALGKKKTDD